MGGESELNIYKFMNFYFQTVKQKMYKFTFFSSGPEFPHDSIFFDFKLIPY